MEVILGAGLAWLFFRRVLPWVVRYRIVRGELQIVIGGLPIWWLSLSRVRLARYPTRSEQWFAPRALNRWSSGRVFLEYKADSYFRPGVLVSPDDPAEFLAALAREGVATSARAPG